MSERPQNVHPKMQWLDIALEGQPAETKAQVLDFCVKFGVDAKDDDFFILLAGIGFLHEIVKQAPETWQETFETFHLELQSWSKTNLNILSAIADQAEANAQQAALTRDLISTLNALTQQLANTKSPMRQDDSNLMSLNKQFLDFREAMTFQLKELNQALLTPSKIRPLSGSISSGQWNAINSEYGSLGNQKSQNGKAGIGTLGWLGMLFLGSIILTLLPQEGTQPPTPEALSKWIEGVSSYGVVLGLVIVSLVLGMRLIGQMSQHQHQQTRLLQDILDRNQQR